MDYLMQARRQAKVAKYNTIGSGSHQLIFEHEQVGGLSIWTGMDAIEWGYGLNTANFNTYAGEVIQILSVFIDDLTIEGTMRTYAEVDAFYDFFLTYLQVATQGDRLNPIRGQSSYNQKPMRFKYPHRGWEFEIIPTATPGLRYGREVVAPTWQLNAHVVDDTGDVKQVSELIREEVELQTERGEEFGLEGKIRFIEDNPFSDPVTRKKGKFVPLELDESFKEISDWYTNLIPSYLEGDFEQLIGSASSKPAFGNKVTVDEGDKNRGPWEEIRKETKNRKTDPIYNR
jgi:hypothetical protein